MALNAGTELNFVFFDDPLLLYNAMLEDIKNAQKYIYIETYKFGNDPIGERFRDILTKKAKQGVEIKILIDSWGTAVNEYFFIELIRLGGEVTFFEKLKLSFDILSKNHRRNHRKLFIVDDKISYIGSANISNHSINWRESVLRLEDTFAVHFKKIFLEDYLISKKIFPNKINYTRSVRFNGFEIIKDVPSTIVQATRKKYLSLIKAAKREIIIESPYFLPGSIVRKALLDAAKKGVEITIITPQHSDVTLFDILRNKYLGQFYKNNIHILLYRPQNLHAKLMFIDDEVFVIGSSNFDYRSFRFQHEINLVGKNKSIIEVIARHIEESKADCIDFNYTLWQKRPWILKTFEWFLVPVRRFF